MLKLKYIFLLITLLTFLACSLGTDTEEEDDNGDTDSETTITIVDNNTFDTSELTASPGETITVINDDDVSHTVTSESDEDEFDDSGDFDTGTISPGVTDSFTIPSDAQDGDIFFFYCDIHTSSMTPSSGMITIEE